MDKKLLDRAVYNIDNRVLEKTIADYAASNKDIKNLEGLIRTFEKSDFIVPVTFPKQAGMKTVLKIINGLPLEKNERVPLIPLIMTDDKGMKFAPAFTSREKIRDASGFPFMVRANAKQVISTALNEKLGLNGVLVNPQGEGIRIMNQAFTVDFAKVTAAPKPQIKKVSREEFILLSRNMTEKNLIPKTLFEQKAEFVSQLEERREEFLLELYNKPYGEKNPSPYTLDEFSVMPLNIDDETTAICMELPAKKMAPGLALSAYVIWNPKAEKAGYYMIEKGQQGESNVLCSITAGMKHEELMTAPPVGSELSAVLDLIREEREEKGEYPE